MSGHGDPVGHGRQAVDDYLRAGFEQYRDHLELLYPFGAVAILALLLEIRLETLEALFDFENFRLTVDEAFLEALLPAPLAGEIAPALAELLWLFLLGLLVLFVLTTLVALFAVGIAFLLATDIRDGRNRSQFARARVALARLPALAVATFLAGLAVAVGLVALVAPGLYLAVKFALAGPAIVADGYGPVGGLRQSWVATQGRFADVGGVLLLSTVSFVLVALVPFVGELLAVLVVLPVAALTIAVFYRDVTHVEAAA